MLNKTIAQLLDIVDSDSSITDIQTVGNIKYITVTKNLNHDLICPLCGSKLNSKGRFIRHPKKSDPSGRLFYRPVRRRKEVEMLQSFMFLYLYRPV